MGPVAGRIEILRGGHTAVSHFGLAGSVGS